MIVNKLPETKVAAKLLNPRHSDFHPVFYETPPADRNLVMATVNAGASYTSPLFEMAQESMTGAFYESVQQSFIRRYSE